MSFHARWHAAGKDDPATGGRSSVASEFKMRDRMNEALPLARLALHHLPLILMPHSLIITQSTYLSIAPVSLEFYLACFHLVAL